MQSVNDVGKLLIESLTPRTRRWSLQITKNELAMNSQIIWNTQQNTKGGKMYIDLSRAQSQHYRSTIIDLSIRKFTVKFLYAIIIRVCLGIPK